VGQFKGFGFIDSFEIRRSKNTGRILGIELTLSDWIYNAIQAKEVLTLHRDYFRLKKPIERRVYEIARNHFGKQDKRRISLDTLNSDFRATVSTPYL
jgi:plasmid replication initiation protein